MIVSYVLSPREMLVVYYSMYLMHLELKWGIEKMRLAKDIEDVVWKIGMLTCIMGFLWGLYILNYSHNWGEISVAH